jgi:Fur family transcriptional regulator, ferric uptake regulator
MGIELVDRTVADPAALEAPVPSGHPGVVGPDDRRVPIDDAEAENGDDARLPDDHGPHATYHGGMDSPPHVAHGTPGGAADLAAQLRSRGLRMTPQREQVLSAVRELGHATPEQISDTVSGVDVTTVYRTLELLEELGLVRHAHLGHGAPSYRPAEDEHIHVVCHTCGKVVDADPALVDEMADRLRSDLGFHLDRAHFTVFGRCQDCAARSVEQIPAAGR